MDGGNRELPRTRTSDNRMTRDMINTTICMGQQIEDRDPRQIEHGGAAVRGAAAAQQQRKPDQLWRAACKEPRNHSQQSKWAARD